MIFTALVLLQVSKTQAHFNLRTPVPYNKIDCNLPRCKGACPPIWRTGRARARNSPQRPAEVWRRGTTRRIIWHRNNHEGGFVRMSLVPVQHMNNHRWHTRTAFFWSCFAANKFRCGRHKSCGTDRNGFAFQNWVRVPEVYPDGDYVVSYLDKLITRVTADEHY